MGWTYGEWPSQAALISELTGEGYGKTIAHQVVGNNLWCVQEYWPGNKYVRTIVLFKMERLLGRWGYKAIEEACGPTEVNCPLEFIQMVERSAGGKPIAWAAKWRERVKAYHAGQNAAQAVLL